MKEENINPTSLHFHIEEYGKIVRQYNDTNYERFMKVTQEMTLEHLRTSGKQGSDQVKNLTFRFYTY